MKPKIAAASDSPPLKSTVRTKEYQKINWN